MIWVLLPVVVLVPATMLAFAIAMLADAWARPAALWERAGRSDRRWWLIALAVSVIPVGWATSVVYFRRVRPGLIHATALASNGYEGEQKDRHEMP